ncbi:hypothetical protein MP228_004402 [Amoeboaphelidium protococcarum]|nr:hypothetical protein MP228_004402 [Amoeboaphelidium protococcarum]
MKLTGLQKLVDKCCCVLHLSCKEEKVQNVNQESLQYLESIICSQIADIIHNVIVLDCEYQHQHQQQQSSSSSKSSKKMSLSSVPILFAIRNSPLYQDCLQYIRWINIKDSILKCTNITQADFDFDFYYPNMPWQDLLPQLLEDYQTEQCQASDISSDLQLMADLKQVTEVGTDKFSLVTDDIDSLINFDTGVVQLLEFIALKLAKFYIYHALQLKIEWLSLPNNNNNSQQLQHSEQQKGQDSAQSAASRSKPVSLMDHIQKELAPYRQYSPFHIDSNNNNNNNHSKNQVQHSQNQSASEQDQGNKSDTQDASVLLITRDILLEVWRRNYQHSLNLSSQSIPVKLPSKRQISIQLPSTQQNQIKRSFVRNM